MRRARRTYRARHAALTAALSAPGFERLRVLPSSAGLHLCTELVDAGAGTARRIRDAAAVAGVWIEPLDSYCADEPREGLVLGFGALPLDQIPEALHILQSALRRVA
jgi:GntR family transcriptional regulator/MocR family aminotransferase